MYIGKESNKNVKAKNGGKDTGQFNEDLYTKRHEEGYDIYDESYVRWLKLHHPDDVKCDWLLQLEASQQS